MLDTEFGPAPTEDLMHTVSFYRRSKPVVQVNVSTVRKIVRNAAQPIHEEEQETEVTKHFCAFVNSSEGIWIRD